jgi:hypothetical protein
MPVDLALRDELLAMADADRRLRQSLPPAVLSDSLATYPVERRDLDAVHAARLWDILDDLECWPGRSLVGDDGAEAAWSLAHHALLDPELQRRCLEMLELAVDCGETPAVHHALLLDRVRMAEGRDQVYGSQLVRRAGGDVRNDTECVEPWPIEDLAGVDARRAAVGLGPLAGYIDMMRHQYLDLVRR